MSIEDLARPEIRKLHAYETTTLVNGAIRLHANEACWSRENSRLSMNRYPETRPLELQARLADRFGVTNDKILATRGSSEAIDLLIRTFCQAGRDNVVLSPPTFVMYKAFADIQGAKIVDCPLSPENDFCIDVDAIDKKCTSNSKLIFLCSPNNPTGNTVSRTDIVRLLEARNDRSIVVVDEAYIEFSDIDSATDLIDDHDNLVVLRTLSKALALAGARCGAVIGCPTLIRMLNAVLAPYALATPVVDCVLRALSEEEEKISRQRIEQAIGERQRVGKMLAASASVKKIWPSQANFVLVQFQDLADAQERLQADGILIRDVSGNPGLDNFARITIGTPDENDRLLSVLQ